MSYGLEKSQLGIQCKNAGHMVLKGVNWVHMIKLGANGLERSQMGTHFDKIRSNGLERSQMGTP